MPLNPVLSRRLLVVSCVSALAALGLMVWSLFDARVVPVIVAMSAGQVLGIASFAVYLWVVVADVVANIRARRR